MESLNSIHYRVKYVPVYMHFDRFTNAYTNDNVVFFDFYSKIHNGGFIVGLHTLYPEYDYIEFEGKIYSGKELFKLCAKIRNDKIRKTIEALP